MSVPGFFKFALILAAFLASDFARADSTLLISTRQKHLIQEITTVFENSTTEFQYGYIEDIEDGAGITAGRVGFNSGCGSLKEFIEKYLALRLSAHAAGVSPLEKYLPCLTQITNSGAYACLFPHVPANVLATKKFHESGLKKFDFGKDWEDSMRDPLMKQAQDSVVDQAIFYPAVTLAESLGLHSALGLSIIYDTILQEGQGVVPGIVRRIQKTALAPALGGDEFLFLQAFLANRILTLRYGFSEQDVMKRVENAYVSYPRAESLMAILNTRNLDLSKPIVIDYFGDHFVVTK